MAVKISGITSDNAILLLAAAEDLDLDASVVRTTSDGHFLVPEEVAKKAGIKADDDEDTKPAQKVAAKKAAAKKTEE